MASKSDRRRLLLGVHPSPQMVALVLTALALALAVGYAVLVWLESMA